MKTSKKAKKYPKRIQDTQDRILMILQDGNKTAIELAEILGVDPGTARNRLRELTAGRKVRIADWIVRKTTMAAQYGLGSGRDCPKPAWVHTNKTRPRPVTVMKTCSEKVIYRREPIDEWMFRIRGMAI